MIKSGFDCLEGDKKCYADLAPGVGMNVSDFINKAVILPCSNCSRANPLWVSPPVTWWQLAH
jgi:hypothetical protein